MSKSELACTYAALILHDDGLEITADNLNSILKAAKVEVEPYWPGLFAKLFAKKKMDDLITNVGAAAPAAAPAAGGAAPAAGGAAAPAKKEEKKEESEEEDMGFSLFD
uniref:60S acidic ribosomal protein P1 n=2 Tax=Eukaryota TaxID=2759 RepID=A0A7S3R8E5_DUNTE|mmetsp:Transcript_22828/g.63103  ORF Transcript_22828/g.63103 Transcript_22828/m.63103 type:complete len:108 (+) Transcript_22828:76-399(+)|eukprot:CAMPEP_0202350132 /NCGR_PEP_ID=MMETSP1126-20121109/7327_1 /ASSEMBLY_ACC=CAM_ASM_000457 /TAXON_ID=3047 /ORGANISM="Dunaliella tertiolecta, Strain CCMP1320" /LENGTH=107 /DNA_ID=CAMNT_0048942043 /DNA_START=108 /DNA_END=431 /DNA_ORIENTATION=+